MDNRDTRSYSYDEQQQAYSVGQGAPHGMDFTVDGYSYESSGQYYAMSNQSLPNSNDLSLAPNPYARSSTPSMSSANRYQNTARDMRYPSQGYTNTSTANQSPYQSTHTASYNSQYLPMTDQNASHNLHQPQQQPRFIPTPSQIANSYSNYPQPMSNPSGHDNPYGASTLDYSSNSHLVSSSTGRPARINTARPRGASGNTNSPSSATSSPSNERFPCEKCGKTFSRSHDRKRHYETQHHPTPVSHRCMYCHKDFSRADSRKRHLDNGCDEMRS